MKILALETTVLLTKDHKDDDLKNLYSVTLSTHIDHQVYCPCMPFLLKEFCRTSLTNFLVFDSTSFETI